MTDSFEPGYYADLESRVRGLISSVERLFPSDQIAQLLELADHNEPGAAVEMLSEMLAEHRAPITRSFFDELHSLAVTMRLEADVGDRLRPLIRDD